MKNLFRKFIAGIMIAVLTVSMSLSIAASADENYPNISGKPLKAYTISSSGTRTYTSASLTEPTGWIDGVDEIRITSLVQNKRTGKLSAKGTYYTPWGDKSAWFAYDAVSLANPLPKEKGTATAKIYTQKRPGGPNYGYIASGDTVYNLGSNGYYTNVLYNTGSASNPTGWKYAWITNSKYNSYVNTGRSNTNVKNGLVSSDELYNAASRYGISTSSNTFTALCSINSKYYDSLYSNRQGTNVFFFEGVGNNSSSGSRMNAMCVVVKNGRITYINCNSSTIPDDPFSPWKNGNTDMPTLKSGIYNFTTVNHKGYAALNVSNGKVVRHSSQNSYYNSTSDQINIHRRSSNSINNSWVNSAGCLIVGSTPSNKNSSDNEYARFIQAVGIVGSNGSSNQGYTSYVTGKVVVDRSYAGNYLRNIGYSNGAISGLG